MRKVFILGILASVQLFGACAPGFISIVDPFLNPNGTAWSGSIVYTLAYNTTVAGATVVGARQQLNVTGGINICLAPGLYSPVSLQQSGFSYVITNSWGVPTSGGPYTIAQIQGNITLIGDSLLSNTVTISNSQMLSANTVAITLLPALGPGIVPYVVRVFVEQKNAYYVTGDQQLILGFGTIGSNTEIGSLGFLTGSTYAVALNSYFLAGTISGQSSNYANLPLIGYADMAVTQPGGTGGNVYVTVWYMAVTLQ